MTDIYFYGKDKKHSRDKTDMLIKKSLTDYANRRGLEIPSEARILRTEYAKPYVEKQGVFLGVTHTDDMLAVALGDADFGIDAENTERITERYKSIAEKYYFGREKEYVFGTSRDKKTEFERFLEIWVKKEAYLKCLGTGLSDIRRANTYELCGRFEKVEAPCRIMYLYFPDEQANVSVSLHYND